MILQVVNEADYDQPIMLHTGESKIVTAGAGIRINTGTDKRLISFYASLIGYQFEVTALEASGQEVNSFEDAVAKFLALKKQSEGVAKLQDRGTYPEDKPVPTPRPLVEDVPNPVTLDRVFNNEPIPQRQVRADVTDVPKMERPSRPAPQQSSGTSGTAPNPVVMDGAKAEILGDNPTPIPDYTQQLPPDYPEDPAAVAEEQRLLKAEQEASAAKTLADNKYAALDALEEDVLKKILKDKFGEDTRLKTKWKIINHIIELADEESIDIFEMVGEY